MSNRIYVNSPAQVVDSDGSVLGTYTTDGFEATGITATGDVAVTGALSAATVEATTELRVAYAESPVNTAGTIVAAIEVFDEAGVSLGKIPVYDDITQV